MSLPRYSEYKDSGVAWLGEVPGHWKVKRLKQACHVFPSNVDKKSHDGETPVNLCNYTDVYYNDTITADMEFMAATASDDQIAKFTLRAGDTIITKDSETADDIAIGAYVPADLPGVICGYHLSMIRPMTDTNGAFVKRLFDSTYVKSCVAVRANGLTRVGLGQYGIDNLELPFPPLSEQQTIAAFLDRETGKIDALIAEQRRLVELLAEKRQAVISHAITKGLPSTGSGLNTRMKDSGIEWLGEVPEHWDVLSVRRIATSVKTGGTPSSQPPSLELEEGVVWYTPGDFDTSIRLGDSSRKISSEVAESGEANMFPAGSVLVVSIGATLGKVGYIDKPSSANQQINAIVPNEKVDGYFLAYSLLVKGEVMRFLSNASTIGIMNQEKTKDIWLAVPPRSEQQAIAAFLDTETVKFDTLTAEANRAIELLQERRSALISAAVTGKIDVLGYGAYPGGYTPLVKSPDSD